MAAHDPTRKGPLIPIGLTAEEKAHHLEHLPPGLQLSKEELEEYRRAEFETKDWFGRSIAQFERLGNKEKVEELERRKAAFEARTPPILTENASHPENHDDSHGPLHHKPHYLDHDERYKKMVEEKVATWNKEHPNEPLPQEVLKTRDDGSRFIHEDIISKIPTLEDDIKKEFAEQYQEDYEEYENNEKSRIYKDKDGNVLPENDPAYKKLAASLGSGRNEENQPSEEEVQKKVEEEIVRREEETALKAKTTFAYSAMRVDREKVEQEVRTHLASPEEREKRARSAALLAFIENHPLKAEEYAKKDPGLQAALHQYKEQQAREHAQEDVARQVAEGLRNQQLPADDSLSPEEYSQIAPGKVDLVAIPTSGGGGDDGGDYFEGPDDGFGQGGQRSSNQRRRRFSPGGMMQNAGRSARGVRSAAQTAAKIGNLAAKAAPLVTNPAFIIGVLVVILIIIIIVVIATVMGGGGEKTDSGELPVSISKEGPESVNNGEIIEYLIKVSYPGTATNIRITDNIPEGSEFVEASGVYSCEPSPCNKDTRTITWEATAQSATIPSGTPGPSPSPRPTSQPGVGTIHNLGFGASDAKRIDDLVSALSPGSPVIGQGSWVIERAREFNLDPLMIILFKNESQFCNDTGVVSPDGSDPDNYNCGGILWPSAQQETDTARWSARAGPAAYTHIFTFVPTVQDGIGLFFDYASASFYQGKTLQQFYDIYNPCADSSQYGLACGAPEAERMLKLLNDTLGPPCTLGDGCYAGGEGGNSFPPMEFTLKVRPIRDDIVVVNQASAQVIK